MDTETSKRTYTDLSHLTPEQKAERERKRQRDVYAANKAERRKIANQKYWRSKNPFNDQKGESYTREYSRKKCNKHYRKKREQDGHVYIPQSERAAIAAQKRAEKEKRKQEKENKRIMKQQRPAKRIKVKPEKPIKVQLTPEQKLEKRRQKQRENYAKKTAHKVPRPVVPKPVRKAKPPREPKTKPEVLPTLVRDESDFVSVRVDAKTSLWVHRDRVEEVRNKYKLA